MKLNFPLLDEALTVEKATIFVVEDTTVFSRLVRNLYQYQDGIELKIFDEQFRSIKDSELMVVTDILGYDINAAPILKLIHADLENQLNEKPEVKSIIEKLANSITELISYECLENELDLEYDEITVLELIKALGVKIETISDTIFDKIFEILQVYQFLNKKKFLVFINVLSYLTVDEIQKTREYIELSNMDVLFLEPRKRKDFPQYVLDKDYFLLSENMVK
ncbi:MULTISPECIES: type II-A CRISPR-associated protein Csn2 [Streptococcus]|uniref:type II-A CRISPR-associated protein Csn2 n=1 Tax=Streptococcus TaxID=1301 RepID=UPI001C8DDA94|nr:MULTISPECIES: type II-A CRISPR-associated protein Csn2 [Streptococcus]MBY0720472.1 type II-A CRISPR-associated protein Csn2 [Streptococcus sp. 2018110]MCO8235994.1 type II-A CRISPR-associated protein Csn2 [Streptococcus suis]WNN03402.1 type II-A CRISPR-associated protein Csn2 [Streptococcus suis]WNN11601.1 type II-A CRISPR-associated protein Csn2 [Streptococcus suis]WNO81311.1 type II-A CRISPR-associated protein Csn2 [Streptococcus suis]